MPGKDVAHLGFQTSKYNKIQTTGLTARGATKDDISEQFFLIFEIIIFCFVVAIIMCSSERCGNYISPFSFANSI